MRMIPLLLALLLCLAGRAAGDCTLSTDDVCIALGRDGCDPAENADLCGPCAYGMREGSEVSPVNSQTRCIPVTCRAVEDSTARPTFAQDVNTEVGIGSLVSFTCKEGYETPETRLKQIQRVCTDSGEFYSDASCEPLKCEVLDDVANAKPESLNLVPLGSSVAFTCNQGYTANGRPSFSRTCLPTGLLSTPTNCTDFDACTTTPCGESANCIDLPAPSLNYTCTCKPGYVGTAALDGSGCYRLGVTLSDDRLVLTATDLTLYNPELDTTLTLNGIFADLSAAKSSLQTFDPRRNDASLSSLIDALSSRITEALGLTTSKASTARSTEASLQGAQSAQVSRATAAELGIQASADTQSASISSFRASVATETSRAIAAEVSLSSILTSRIDSLASSLESEISRARSVENAQASSVAVLSNTATSVRTDLTFEVSRANSVEATLSTGVLSLAVSLSALSSTVAVLSNMHTTTLSMATSASVATTSTTSRATLSQQSLTASINTLRTDLTGTQTTLLSVSGTVSSREPTLASISTSISSVASQVTSLATAMTALQASTSVATSMYASQSTQINTANTNINSQSTLITTLSSTAVSTSTTQTTLSTTTSSLTNTINVVNGNLGTLNTRVNTMSATSCNSGAGNLLYAFDSGGNPLCAALTYNYLRNWFNAKCWMGVGWRDSCNGCGLTPAKFAYMYANGNCRQSVGTNNACGIPAGWSGINADGTVGDDDNFYVSVGCDA